MFLAIFFFPVYPILSGRGGKSAIEIEARSNLENYGARIIIGSSGGSIKIIDSCFLFVREHGRDMGREGSCIVIERHVAVRHWARKRAYNNGIIPNCEISVANWKQVDFSLVDLWDSLSPTRRPP